MYSLEVSPSADRDLTKLRQRISRPDFERLRVAIGGLAAEPRPQGVRKIRGEEKSFRIRVGGYRVVYEIYDRENIVLLLQVVRRTETTYKSQ